MLGVERHRAARPRRRTARPGSPTAITELARALKPPEARSSQSPSRSVCTAGHDAFASRQACSALTRIRGDGRGGTGLPETMSASAISVSGAVLGAHRASTVAVPGLHHPEQVGHRRAAGRARSARAAPGGPRPAADAVRAETGGQRSWAWTFVLRGGVRCGARPVVILGCVSTTTDSIIGRTKVTYVIAQPCVDLKDRACVDECPVDCIYEGKRMLYIHPDECVDCGACEPVCPVEAIFYEDDTPEQWKDYYNANVDFFDDLGSPGGAAKMGVIDKDHPLVAALPFPQNAGMTHGQRRRAAHLPEVGGAFCFPALPDFPWDHLTAYGDRGPGPPGRDRRPLGRHPRRPDAPSWCSEALADAADSPGLPADGRPARHPAGLRRLAVPALRGDRPRRRRGAAGDRLQGADRLDARPISGSAPATWSCTRSWPTRRTRWAPGSPGPARVATDALTSVGPERVSLVWVNSPSNPTGRVLPVEHLRKVVAWCRERGALLVSDECYLECAWDGRAAPVSVLHPDVCDGDHTGILAVHSLSKRSNLAGYRCAFVAGDRDVVAELLAVRKNLGLQMPGPQQRAMRAALDDDAHVDEQHARYARAARRRCRAAFEGAGFRVDHSEASLYLWVTRDEPCWDTVGWLADRGILVAPGRVLRRRPAPRHVRVAFTATDERVAAAVRRLAAG